MKRYILTIAVLLCSAIGAKAATLAVPGNFQVTLTDGNQFRLNWEKPAVALDLYYEIYQSTGTAVGTVNLTATTTDLYFTDTTVAPGTPYFYKVRARGATITADSALADCPAIHTNPLPPNYYEEITLTPQNSKIFIQWKTAYDSTVTSYNLYRAVSNTAFSKLADVPKNQGQYLDTSAANGVEYSYMISAQYNGEGAFSNPKSMTPAAAPFAPLSLSGTAFGPVVTLLWSPDGVRGTYDVKRYNIYDGNIYLDSTADSITANYTTGSLATGQRHYFKVTAEDVLGNTSMPSYTSVYVSNGTVEQPTGLSAYVTSTYVYLTWTSANDPDQIDGYEVYKDGALLGTTDSAAYTDTLVTAETTYNYHVIAYKETIFSSPSVVLPVTAVIAAPVNLTVSQTGAGMLALSWAKATGESATVYNVYRSKTAGLFTAPLITQTADAYFDSGLDIGDMYYYRVSLTKTASESAYAEISARAVTVPVSEITGVMGDAFNGYVNISWTAEPAFDLTSYRVYYKLSSAGTYSSLTTSATNMIISPLVNGSSYTVNVAGTNALGSGVTITANNFTIIPSSSVSLGAAQNLTVDSPGNSSLVLTWDGVKGAYSYRIYRSLNSGGIPDSILATVTAVSYVDVKVYTADAYYSYKIEALDNLSNPSGVFSDIQGNSAFAAAAAPQYVELNNTAGGIILSWAKPESPYTYNSSLKYRIYSSTHPDAFEPAPIGETFLTYYEDALPNTSCAVLYYKVKSVDAMGHEDTDYAVYSINVSQPIDPPAVLVARPGNKRVTLTWKKVTPEYYNIYRSTDAYNFTYPIAYNINFDNREYIDTYAGLLNKTEYFYTVAAVTRGGEGPKSVTASAVPYAPPVINNRRVTCTAKDGKDVQVDWVGATAAALGEGYDILGYRIFRSLDNGWTYNSVTSIAYHSAGYAETFTDTQTSWDNQYTYMIRVEDTQGNTDAVYDPASVLLPLPKNKLKLYSNLIDLSRAQSLTWQYVIVKGGRIKVNVYTLSGAFVKNIFDEEYTAPVSALTPYESPKYAWDGTNAKGVKSASGVYLIMLELNGERTIEKIAVLK